MGFMGWPLFDWFSNASMGICSKETKSEIIFIKNKKGRFPTSGNLPFSCIINEMNYRKL
ncbi:hypothetical protein G4D92_000381 [Listeria monocytogenes]|nr:hypothetical protein [Listeria monocytogenes]